MEIIRNSPSVLHNKHFPSSQLKCGQNSFVCPESQPFYSFVRKKSSSSAFERLSAQYWLNYAFGHGPSEQTVNSSAWSNLSNGSKGITYQIERHFSTKSFKTTQLSRWKKLERSLLICDFFC